MGDRDDLVDHLVRMTGMERQSVDWLITEVTTFYGETTNEFVSRRHGELRRQGRANAEIYQQITEELTTRPVLAPELSLRQLRRIVTG